MRSLLLTFLLLFASSSAALPGARPGVDCENLLDRERNDGAIVTLRKEDKRYFVSHKSAMPPRSALYTCVSGKVEEQRLILHFSSRDRAFPVFLELRDELERDLGKPIYDDTNPADRRSTAEALRVLGPDVAGDGLAGTIMWKNWSVLMFETEHELGNWWVALTF